MTKVNIHLLGPFEVYLDTERVHPSQFGSRKARDVLRWLADARGQVVTDHLLSHSLWPDISQERAVRSLRVRVSELRKFFSSVHVPIDLVERSTDGYMLRIDPNYVEVDVDWFEKLVSEAENAHSPDQALPLLTKALALYKDDYMSDDVDAIQWHDARTRYRTLFLTASSKLATVYEKMRLYDDGIRLLRQTLNKYEAEEGLYRQLIRLQYLHGDQAGALRTYQECRAYLDRELGVTPMPETMRLLQKVLRHELIPEEDEPREKITATPFAPKSSVTWPFLGRMSEMATMQNYVEQLMNEQRGGVVWLHGPSGIGKTRFLQEFLRTQKHSASLRTIWIQGSKLNARIPFAGVVDALQAYVLPTLLPEEKEQFVTPPLPRMQQLVGWGKPKGAAHLVEGKVEKTTDDVWLRQEFIELFMRFTRSKAVICCVDDVDTLDSATQSLLLALTRRIQHAPLLFVFTSRTPPRKEQIGQEFAQANVECTDILLKPLHIDALRSLIGRGIPVVWSHRWLQQLYKETGGDPFALIRTLHSLRERKLLDIVRGEVVFPRGILSLMTRRALEQSPTDERSSDGAENDAIRRQIDQTTYTVLCKAAVLGDSLTLGRLRKLAGEPADVFQKALDTLIQHAYFEFQSPSSGTDMVITFSHHRLQHQIYHNISEAERIWYHHGVYELLCDELEGHTNDHTDVKTTRLLSEIAYHALRCGTWREAAKWSLRAAKAAEAITPGAEVVLLCRQAYDAAQRAMDEPKLVVETRFALAEALYAMGLVKDAVSLYKTLDEDGHPARDLVKRRLVKIYLDLNQLEEALDMAEDLVAASGEDNEAQGLALQTLMDVHYRLGNVNTAIEYGKNAIQLLKDERYAEARSDVYYSLCLLFWDLGEYGEALALAKKHLAIRQRTQSAKLINSLNVVGELYQDLFCIDLALQYHRKALKLAIRDGRLMMSVEIWRNLGLDFIFEGRFQKGMSALLRAWQQAEDLNLGVYRQELHLRTLLEASLLAHDVAEAKRYLALYEKVTGLRERSFVTIFSAAIALLENRLSEGERVLQGVLDFWDKTGRRGRAMHVLLFVGETLMLHGNNTLANKYVHLAYKEMQRIMKNAPPEVVHGLQESRQFKTVQNLMKLS